MPAVRRTRTMRFLWRAHRWAYRVSGGRVGRKFSGMPILLLTTTGRKSGKPRDVALMHLREGDSFVVIASNAGEPTHPGWLHNLRSNPQATVRVGRQAIPVVAREAAGDERAAMWRRAIEADESYAEYEQRTDRQIPVVVLDPVT